jgi:hypothetical protein
MRNGCIRQKRGNGRHCGIPARSHGDEDLSTLVLGNLKGREAPNGLATYFIPCLTLNFSVKRRCAWFPALRECFRDVRTGKDKLPHLNSPRFLLRRDHPQPLHLVNWLRIGPIVYILSIPQTFSTYILHNVPDSTSLSAMVRAEPASQSTI